MPRNISLVQQSIKYKKRKQENEIYAKKYIASTTEYKVHFSEIEHSLFNSYLLRMK